MVILNTTHICKHFNIKLGTRPLLTPLLSKFTILSSFPIRNVWWSNRAFQCSYQNKSSTPQLGYPYRTPTTQIFDIWLHFSTYFKFQKCMPLSRNHPPSIVTLPHPKHIETFLDYLYITLGTCFQLVTLHCVDSNKFRQLWPHYYF